jgi:hypothetical protein
LALAVVLLLGSWLAPLPHGVTVVLVSLAGALAVLAAGLLVFGPVNRPLEPQPEPVGLAGSCSHGVAMLDECRRCEAERGQSPGEVIR